MLKKIGYPFLALIFAFTGYLFWQAGQSETTVPAASPANPTPEATTTIAFGSCNRQDEDQGYWATIANFEPDAWLWLGDNVYADGEDMGKLREEHEVQKNAPSYVAFRKKVPLIYGVYDDHDYGLNDGGKEWKHRDAAKNVMLDFLDVPATAAVRQRPGAYQSYLIGEGERSIKVILLDARYFRDPVFPATQAGHRYGPNPDGDVLGDAQWAWLEEELTNSTAAAHLIVSSYQVLPVDHPYEKWALFPKARQRLLALLEQTRPALPLLLSGDRHLAEASRDSVGSYVVTELTSSGLTHSYENARETNSLRISPLVDRKNFGLLRFVWTSEPQLIAEVRSVTDGRLFFDLTLPTNTAMSRSLPPCPQSPNCVSTQTDQDDKKREPIAYAGDPNEAKAKLKSVVEAMPRTQLVAEEDNYLHYTFKTWPIPFTDDVEFVFDDATKQIHYRSASRVGHSDLGVNSKRMAKVVAAFQSK